MKKDTQSPIIVTNAIEGFHHEETCSVTKQHTKLCENFSAQRRRVACYSRAKIRGYGT